jgi:uncharacterized membrane protein (DUF373 family)
MFTQPPRSNEARRKGWHGEGDQGRGRYPGFLNETAEAWSRLGLYERFEQLASLVLTVVISAVIVVAIAHLVIKVAQLLVFDLMDPVEHAAFQAIFGMILTVLIAMEFNHSVLGILRRRQSIVQLRTVILIALLAMARKFIIIDATSVAPLSVIGLAFAALALGSVYWLVREQDHRETKGDGRDTTSSEAPGRGRQPGASAS